MVRAFLPVVRAALLTIGSIAVVHAAMAGDRDGDRRTGNTFILVTATPPKPAATPPQSSNGVGVAPAKPIVSNPYQVPLLQNAGTLRGR